MVSKKLSSAFTIVELLVVVVIIGVLSAVTLVAYANISRQAVVSSMQSDLSNASTALKAFQAEKGNFPTTISIDCTASPDTSTNKCLKVSNNNTYSNYVASNGAVPKTFSLTISNPGVTYGYIITSESKPSALSIAPNSPIADWLATLQGDHYGNYYDLVGKTWATVTRAGTKTIFDPQTQHIYDVPANYLAITPRSDGKNGVEAVIEEGRTNGLLNSDFELDSNSDGTPDNWNSTVVFGGGEGTSGVYNTASTHGSRSYFINKTNSAGQVFTVQSFTTTPGNTYTYSCWVKSTTTSALIDMSHDSVWAQTYVPSNKLNQWARLTNTFTNTTMTTSSVRVGIYGGPGTAYFDGCQLEVGSFATSYMPTTTTAVTRNADVVSIPTTSWNINAGVFIATLGRTFWGGGAAYPRILSWSNGSDTELFALSFSSQTNFDMNTRHGGIWGTDAYGSGFPTYGPIAYRYESSGLKHRVFVDGVGATEASMTQYPTGLQATAGIGTTSAGGSYLNGPMQRFTVYTSALSDSDIASASSAIKDGPQ